MNISLADIDLKKLQYSLPDKKVAKYPLLVRDESKLLVYNKGEISDHIFHELPELIPGNSLLVFNNTRVMHARLIFRKTTGAKIEIFCLEPQYPGNYEEAFLTRQKCVWKCLIGNQKKWKEGSLQKDISYRTEKNSLKAILVDKQENLVQFEWDNPNLTFSDIIDTAGDIPIPPYLNRESETGDELWYQTVYSKTIGSVAAPTAGLHFTDAVLTKLQDKGIQAIELTLHVGAGTFKPIQGDLENHEMHTEHFMINRKQVNEIAKAAGRIVAVGTTSVRTLESIYWLGVKIMEREDIDVQELFIDQWEAYSYDIEIPPPVAMQAVLDYMDKREIEKIEGFTKIIIVPGYKFRIVQAMVTNYHLPKSTLLLLISAFIGENWEMVYKHALDNNYRFLSYGDSSLLIP